MMEGMRLRFAHCAARSTLCGNVMETLAQSVLTHTLVGTQLLIRHNIYCICFAKEFKELVLCWLLCRKGYRFILVGFYWGR